MTKIKAVLTAEWYDKEVTIIDFVSTDKGVMAVYIDARRHLCVDDINHFKYVKED